MQKKLLAIILAFIAAIACVGFILWDKTQTNAQQTYEKNDIVINEVMSSNSGIIPDQNGNFFDWIELHNTTDKDVSLTGWMISDRTSQPRWSFPNDTTIPANGYIVVYCAGKTSDIQGLDGYYTQFKLKAGEDVASLFNPSRQLVDSVEVPVLASGHSWGRSSDDPNQWLDIELPTPNFPNTEQGRLDFEATIKADDIGLILSEFQANNRTTLFAKLGDRPDWIELYNETQQEIDISGFGLSTDPSKPMEWRFPANTKIQPNEYLIVFASGDETRSTPEELHTNFKISSFEGSVLLSNARGQLLDKVTYQELPIDYSYARMPDGSWSEQIQPTPRKPNTEDGIQETLQAQQDVLGDLYISEAMLYNTQYIAEIDDEYQEQLKTSDWIELHNRSASPIDLSGYGLTNNSQNPAKWRFPEGTVIEPDEYLVLYATGRLQKEIDAATASNDRALSYLELNYKLSNANGEIITLWNTENELVDKIVCTPQHRQVSYGRDTAGNIGYMAIPTPGVVNEALYNGYAKTPVIDSHAGFYTGVQNIAITKPANTMLYYTTDGSEPTNESTPYNSPIAIDKTSVIRARTYSNDSSMLPSEIATSTFIIDNPHSDEFSIVSIAMNPDDLFSQENGIYAKGSNASNEFPYLGANFWIRDWEKPAHVEIFKSDGSIEISQDAATRIFGSYSRGYDQKGFSLIARSTFDEPKFNYPLFPNRDFDSYKSFVLRAGAQDSTLTKIHDIVATSLVDGTTNLKVQAYRQAVLYINGEYFGIYNIREKVTRFWIADHYNLIDPDNIDLLVGMGTPVVGDDVAYKELLTFCKQNSLSIPENYEKVKSMVDIENFIDYLIAEMYVANTDTGNIKWFREKTDDPERSKFRWIYYDFCWSFMNIEMDSMNYWTDPKGHGVNKVYSTQLQRSLFENQDFRNQFLRRAAELLNTVYTPENVLTKINQVAQNISSEIDRDTTRWPWYADNDRVKYLTPEQSANTWRSNVDYMRKFAQERPGYFIYSMQKYFALTNEDVERIFGQPSTPFTQKTSSNNAHEEQNSEQLSAQ